MNLDRPLGTHGLGDLERLATGMLRVESELRDALAIAQVAENESAVVATAADPTGKGNFLADVLGTKLTAGACMHGMGVDRTCGLCHVSSF